MDEEAGTIEIPTDGLYLVYAQVFIILSCLNPSPKNPNFAELCVCLHFPAIFIFFKDSQ